MKKYLLLFILLIAIQNNFGQSLETENLLSRSRKNYFIENNGQWSEEVKYLARLGGMSAWITNTGVVYDYQKYVRNYNPEETIRMHRHEREYYERENTMIYGHFVKMNLKDSNPNNEGIGKERSETYYNYFIGNDESKWASFVPLYGEVEIDEIYEGIDIRYYFDEGLLRYDYKAEAGAEISRIEIEIEGADGVKINENGELIIETSLGEVTHGKLYTYQNIDGEEEEIECGFEEREEGRIGIYIGEYDKRRELIIDPLIYSTFLGGNSGEIGYSIAIDEYGNAYITGDTNSENFPVTTGAFQTVLLYSDVFVTKLNPSGSDVVYSTYLGGYNVDYGRSIAIDEFGYAYVTGSTYSENFPVTNGTFQINHRGFMDLFITKLDLNGSQLIYSTFVGGDDNDGGVSIAVDEYGNAYVTGSTYSENFPFTNGAFQIIFGGGSVFITDVFITKLNSTGNQLIYSTYLGGNNSDHGHSIAIDDLGNAYITGYTESDNFPVTTGAFQTNYGGSDDAFVTKLNSIGSDLIYSTFIGGNEKDLASSIVIDNFGNAYITGLTESDDFPVTTGAFQTSYGLRDDVFVAKLNSIGSDLIYSTFIGGNEKDLASSIAIDNLGNAYITGKTGSSNFPITNGAVQTSFGGGYSDAFVTKLNSTGSQLIYSTYLGGYGLEEGHSITIDGEGIAYVTGNTESNNFPVNMGAYQTSYWGNWGDAFVTKIYNEPGVVKVEEEIEPKDFALNQNYPNPFNPTTKIKFVIPSNNSPLLGGVGGGLTTLKIFDILGREITTLLNKPMSAGTHEVEFGAANLPSGIYFYQLQTGSFTDTKKMLLLK